MYKGLYHTVINMDYEQILNKGSRDTNEDLCQVIPEQEIAWVIDGTSGVSDKTLFPDAPSDGRWFVNRINSHMLSRINDSMSLTNLVRYGIRETTLDAVNEMSYSGHPRRMQFDDIDDTLSTLDLPAATIAVVDWSGMTVDIFTLGDSGVVVSKSNGTTHVIQGDPKQFEMKVDEDDLSDDKYMEKIRDIRKRQQIPGGYWVVGFNPIAADFAVEEKYYDQGISSILLTTGGFTTIVNEYGIYDEWSDVIDETRNTSLQTLVKELREYEQKNLKDTHKPHDDVGLIQIKK